MKNIGNSILPSNCPAILTPMQVGRRTLKVIPDEVNDTHCLICAIGGNQTILASHPNGYSCHSLAKRIIEGDDEQIDRQAIYIRRCGGTSMLAKEILAQVNPPKFTKEDHD